MAIRIEDLPVEYQNQVKKQLSQNKTSFRPAKAGTKYHNVEVEFKGIRFKSKKEQRRFLELYQLYKAGAITDLKLQPQFTLIESYIKPSGEKVSGMKYTADFSYLRDGQLFVEDVKSKVTKTTDYKIRKNLMLDIYGIVITEI